MVVTINPIERFHRHSEETSRAPDIHAVEHQPGRSGVSESMWRHPSGKLRETASRIQRCLDGRYRFAVPFDEMLDLAGLPPSHMREQSRWDRRRRLAFFGWPCSLREPVEHAALQIHERSTLSFVGRSFGNGASSRPRVKGDQNEAGEVPERETSCWYPAALVVPSVTQLNFSIPPASPKEFGGLLPGEPA